MGEGLLRAGTHICEVIEVNINSELFLELFKQLTGYDTNQITNVQALGLWLEEMTQLRTENKMLKEMLEKK